MNRRYGVAVNCGIRMDGLQRFSGVNCLLVYNECMIEALMTFGRNESMEAMKKKKKKLSSVYNRELGGAAFAIVENKIGAHYVYTCARASWEVRRRSSETRPARSTVRAFQFAFIRTLAKPHIRGCNTLTKMHYYHSAGLMDHFTC